MCKILALTDMTKIKKIDPVINASARELSERERDGFGYSILSAKGVFGERTLSPSSFKTSFKRELLDVPFAVLAENRFGEKAPPTGPGVFHGRTSTNDRTLTNTHPINKHGWSLIHNGVVTNHGPDYERITTNDTEDLVELLGTKGVSAIEAQLTGYYAVAAIDPNGNLNIIRDSTANLFVTKVSTIDSYLFGTTRDLIEDFCRTMKWKHSTINEVEKNVHLVFNGNELVHHGKITPKGRTWDEDRHAEKSLGRVLDATKSGNWVNEAQVQTPSRYTEDELLFLDEVTNHADSSYSFFDYKGESMAFRDFVDLDDDEKLYCKVVRPDGTIVDQEDHTRETLWEGWTA